MNSADKSGETFEGEINNVAQFKSFASMAYSQISHDLRRAKKSAETQGAGEDDEAFMTDWYLRVHQTFRLKLLDALGMQVAVGEANEYIDSYLRNVALLYKNKQDLKNLEKQKQEGGVEELGAAIVLRDKIRSLEESLNRFANAILATRDSVTGAVFKVSTNRFKGKYDLSDEERNEGRVLPTDSEDEAERKNEQINIFNDFERRLESMSYMETIIEYTVGYLSKIFGHAVFWYDRNKKCVFSATGNSAERKRLEAMQNIHTGATGSMRDTHFFTVQDDEKGGFEVDAKDGIGIDFAFKWIRDGKFGGVIAFDDPDSAFDPPPHISYWIKRVVLLLETHIFELEARKQRQKDEAAESDGSGVTTDSETE